MKEPTIDQTVNAGERVEEVVSREVKKTYSAPNCESHKPLEIMSAWDDQSSELQF